MKTSRVIHLLIALTLAAAFLPAAAPAAAQANPPVANKGEYVPGEVVVVFQNGGTDAAYTAQAQALAGQVGASVVQQASGMALLSLDPNADVAAAAAKLSGQSGVIYAGPNTISRVPEDFSVKAQAVTPTGYDLQTHAVSKSGAQINSTHTYTKEELMAMRRVVRTSTGVKAIPTFPFDSLALWGYWRINANMIWSDKGLSPMVCVLDTGVDGAHPDLAGVVVNGYDFVNLDPIPNDDFGHGTHVAGIIAAKTNNLVGSVAGISNGKVLAVKVLGANGSGSAFEIAQGIRFCADNPAVKVLNMSLGGAMVWGGPEYLALKYAIVTKGKLVVAAAGNSSTSDRTSAYPAAWADDPTIGAGLISVGSSVEGSTWVDTNGNGIKDETLLENCASYFSNFGSWVKMVAPGSSIYSTTPVSYPFFLHTMFGYASGYDYLSGTSMATPQVAGAAARVWGLDLTKSNQAIANTLINSGRPLNLAVDTSVSYPYIDYPWYLFPKANASPFCWPKSTPPFYSGQDMTNSRFLDVAGAMGRGALEVAAWDAQPGVPLIGATIQAVSRTSNLVKDTVMIPNVANAAPVSLLIDLPVDPNGYNLKISKAGYTAGYQTYNRFPVNVLAGTVNYDDQAYVSVPPNNQFQVAADWHGDSVGYTGSYDFDLSVLLPAGAFDPNSGLNDWLVGGGWNRSFNEMAPGDLGTFPFARWHHDGGAANSLWKSDGDWVENEDITIAKKPGTSFPYFIDAGSNGGPATAGYYNIFVRDYSTNTSSNLNQDWVYVRVWLGGVVKAIWRNDVTCGNTEDWYWAGSIYKQSGVLKYQEVSTCGLAPN